MKVYFENKDNLPKKYIDFLDWCLKNSSFIINSSVKKISNKYGVGISFIYNFLKVMNLKHFKDFCYFLVKYKDDEKNDETKRDKYNIVNKSINTVFTETNRSNYNYIEEQKNNIIDLIDIISKSKEIYLFGYNYSKVACQDLAEFLTYWTKKIFIIHEKKMLSNFKNKVSKNSILLIYSMRAVNPSLNDLLSSSIFNDCYKCLITANIESNLKEKVDNIIKISNIMIHQDVKINNTILDPTISFAYFNSILKSYFYLKNKDVLIKNVDYEKELESWYNYETAKKIKEE